MRHFLYIAITFMGMETAAQILFTAKEQMEPRHWRIVNDGVMGGVSAATIGQNAEGHLVFSGTVRLENNGGFASVRRPFEAMDVSDRRVVRLRLKGDGKTYQFRIKSTLAQRYSYVHEFPTTGQWEDVELPLADFRPRFRGRALDLPNYPGEVLEEMALLIGNKRKEAFRLEIQEIVLP